MSCIAYIFGEGEHSSFQIKELTQYSTHFDIHISPWVFDKSVERKNLKELIVNPKKYDMELFLTMTILNLGDNQKDGVDAINAFIHHGIHVICLKENIDTGTSDGLKDYYAYIESYKLSH